jgi:transposase
MKETRRRYDRDFKISVLTELEVGKLLAQVARELVSHLRMHALASRSLHA